MWLNRQWIEPILPMCYPKKWLQTACAWFSWPCVLPIPAAEQSPLCAVLTAKTFGLSLIMHVRFMAAISCLRLAGKAIIVQLQKKSKTSHPEMPRDVRTSSSSTEEQPLYPSRLIRLAFYENFCQTTSVRVNLVIYNRGKCSSLERNSARMW